MTVRILFAAFVMAFQLIADDGGSKLRPGAELDYNFSFLPKVVARYDGRELTPEKVISLIKPRLKSIQGVVLNEKQLKIFVVNFLDDYYQRVASLELARKSGYELNIGLAELRLQQLEEKNGKKKIQEEFKSTGVPYEKAAVFLAETRIIDQWFAEKVLKECKVEEAEALLYYSEHEEKFKQPQRVQVAEVYAGYLTGDQKKKAYSKLNMAMKELQLGTKFEDVARKYSEGQQAKNGGVMAHMFSREELKKELQVAFDLKKGQISEIIESPSGYHIIKVVDKSAAGTPKFDEVKGQLMKSIMQEKAVKLMQMKIRQQKVARGFRIFIE